MRISRESHNRPFWLFPNLQLDKDNTSIFSTFYLTYKFSLSYNINRSVICRENLFRNVYFL